MQGCGERLVRDEEIYGFMAQSELFKDLNPVSASRVASRLKRVHYASDSIICQENDAGDKMFIIIGGEITVQKDLGWGQRELDRMGSGSAFGEMALITTEHRTATVRTLSETECLQLDRADFNDLLDQDPHFAQRVAQVLSKRLAALGKESSQDLLSAYRALMFALAGLAEFRDPETGAHLERTRDYCTFLADLLLEHPAYSDVVQPAFVDAILYVSPLHDIGKVAIPDSILLKPGKLTEKEYAVMKTHTTAGAQALKKVIDQSDEEIFRMAYRICLHHHERWDGTGYPLGFSRDEIPVEARIMAIADVFDALLSKRVYKPAFTFDETLWELRNASGTQFDPQMIEVFVKNGERFEEIHRRYSDH